uniref:Uncharacterized protein n=1 Tax=Anser brachyrhynchus TaxID=132585 RepID=A0A8B9C6R5_9AVES
MVPSTGTTTHQPSAAPLVWAGGRGLFLAPRGTGTHHLPWPPAPAGSTGRSAPHPWLLRERGERGQHLQEMGHKGARGGLQAMCARLRGRSPGLSPPCHQRGWGE